MFEFTLDLPIIVQMVLTVFMPIAVGLVTTKTTPSSVQAWLLAGLTLITSLLVELSTALGENGTFDIGLALLTAIPAFAISVSTYYGLWKPTGIGHAAQSVERTVMLR